MYLKKRVLIVCAVGVLNLSACSGGQSKTYGLSEKEWQQLTTEQKQEAIEKHHNRGEIRQLERDQYWKEAWEKRRAEMQNGSLQWKDYSQTE
jgi:hypothetical protein